jgi:hypothetical protein
LYFVIEPLCLIIPMWKAAKLVSRTYPAMIGRL